MLYLILQLDRTVVSLLSKIQYMSFSVYIALAHHMEIILNLAIYKLIKYFLQVPNPLFDLAGIMCGQFGIPFWEFFLATMIGKAIIKTHIQVS